MVLEIRLSNIYSIDEEVVLDMQAANLKSKKAQNLIGNTFAVGDERMLKTIAIYGANASGKSNILKGIKTFIDIIRNSHNYNANNPVPVVPFKFRGDSKPSSFYIRFILDGIEYEYAYAVKNGCICTESLYSYPKGRRAMIFVRDESLGPDKNKIYRFQNALKRPQEVTTNTSNHTLFLSRASQMDREEARKIFRWFNDDFVFDGMSWSPAAIQYMLENNKEQILHVLSVADSDITDISFVGERLVTTHRGNPTVKFDFYTEESQGTVKLLNMTFKLMEILQQGKTMFIDEIETSLHTKLVGFIVKAFNESDSAQLVFSTHNTYFLNFDIMRKDQIYFTNKKPNGSTELYSLYDYKGLDEGADLSKCYLQGMFDAIPYIGQL